MNLRTCGGAVGAAVLSFTYSSLVSSMFMKEIATLKDIYAITKNI